MLIQVGFGGCDKVVILLKFLVSADGLTINRYAPTTNPMDIKEDIELFLQKI